MSQACLAVLFSFILNFLLLVLVAVSERSDAFDGRQREWVGRVAALLAS